MCGIAGILSFKSKPRKFVPNLISMTKSMATRGPDDEGYTLVKKNESPMHLFGSDTPNKAKEELNLKSSVYDQKDSENSIFLGHRRLSIIDTTSGGHQPMSDQSKRYTITYNGELYNYKHIQKRLKALGYHFRTNSDTEVLLNSYIEWGENCVKYFNGDWAFAIWDDVEKSLFCSRDRIGIKPFYYYLNKDFFLFSSDIKSIIASGLYTPEPDGQGLYLAMAFGISTRPITAFKNILALEQSHSMKISRNGSLVKTRYWQIPVGTQDKSMSVCDARDGLRQNLSSAIKRRLISDVETGTLMSGGVDSTLISTIAKQSNEDIKAFTLGFEDSSDSMDETNQASKVAKIYDIKHFIYKVSENNLKDQITKMALAYEEPFYSLSPNFLIFEFITQSGVKVILNGLGGDELFAGYKYYHPSIFKNKNIIKQNLKPVASGQKLNEICRILDIKHADMLHTLFFQKIPDYKLNSLFKENFRLNSSTKDFVHNIYAKNYDFEDQIEAISFMDLKNYVGNHHVHRVDQFSMCHSIESRFPFLDHELIEFSFKIPSEIKLKDGNRKYILKKVAEEFLPSSIIKSTKKGFRLPMGRFMQSTLKKTTQEKIEKLQSRELVNPDFVRTLYKSYSDGKESHSLIWHLVNLEMWFEHFMDPGNKLSN